MMVFKKALPRRTFLRGLGTTLALPLLDGMIPALAAQGKTVAKPATRLSIVYLANGRIMDKWTPNTEGADSNSLQHYSPLPLFEIRFSC